MQINILEAKNHLSQLIRSVEAGKQVLIARRGKPVAQLVSVAEHASVASGAGDPSAILSWLAEHPLPAYAQRKAREIDHAIAEARASWD
ncbi:MAG: type II toxin-antitoxin system prevent-host-death family antitoxin [Rhodanobacter sp.]